MEKYYGKYGGQYVPENALKALNSLEEAFIKYKDDPNFKEE